MKFALLIALITAQGAQIEGAPFDTLAECEKALADLPAAVAEANVKKKRILFYAGSCTPVLPAGAGV